MVEVHDYDMARKLFLELGGFTSSDLTTFLRKNEIDSRGMAGIPVFAVMKALNKERKKKQFGEDSDLDRALKEEKVQKARLDNQKELGLFISKVAAKARVRQAFMAVANKIRYSIKQIAPRVAICSNARDCENICIGEYNKSIDFLKQEAKDITWENDGIEDKLGRTDLAKDSEEDTLEGSNQENAVAVEGQRS